MVVDHDPLVWVSCCVVGTLKDLYIALARVAKLDMKSPEQQMVFAKMSVGGYFSSFEVRQGCITAGRVCPRLGLLCMSCFLSCLLPCEAGLCRARSSAVLREQLKFVRRAWLPSDIRGYSSQRRSEFSDVTVLQTVICRLTRTPRLV